MELNNRLADSAKAQGLEVFNGFLHDALYEEKSFDAIFLGEVIEHVNSPRDLITDCKRFLKNGGLIIITTPNINCFWSKVTLSFYKTFGIPWSAATPPYHLFEFDNNNLDLLLTQEGLKPIDEKYMLPPKLTYELGSLHLLKRYKQSRRISDLVFMLFSYSIYTLSYIVSVVFHPLLKTDFEMIKVYENGK